MPDTVKGLFHHVPIEVVPHTGKAKSLLRSALRDSRVCLGFLNKIPYHLVAILVHRDPKQWLITTAHEPWHSIEPLCCHTLYSSGCNRA